MKILIQNETGKPRDLRIIDQETGQSLPVVRIEIEPCDITNAFCPAVTILLRQALPLSVTEPAIHLVSDQVTVLDALGLWREWLGGLKPEGPYNIYHWCTYCRTSRGDPHETTCLYVRVTALVASADAL